MKVTATVREIRKFYKEEWDCLLGFDPQVPSHFSAWVDKDCSWMSLGVLSRPDNTIIDLDRSGSIEYVGNGEPAFQKHHVPLDVFIRWREKQDYDTFRVQIPMAHRDVIIDIIRRFGGSVADLNPWDIIDFGMEGLE